MILTLNAYAGQFADCKEEDKCQYKNCNAQVAESIGNTAMATCREVYKLVNGKHEMAYHEVKVISQTIDPETKKSTMAGNTFRIK
jgi:hypothetical protein